MLLTGTTTDMYVITYYYLEPTLFTTKIHPYIRHLFFRLLCWKSIRNRFMYNISGACLCD